MLKTLRVAALLTSLTPALAFAQNFEAGLAAAQSGDFATAIQEWQPHADAGDARAQVNLGLQYANGTGLLQNMITAHMWLNIAKANQNRNAEANLRAVEANLTSAQIEAAVGLAQACYGSDYTDCPD